MDRVSLFRKLKDLGSWRWGEDEHGIRAVSVGFFSEKADACDIPVGIEGFCADNTARFPFRFNDKLREAGFGTFGKEPDPDAFFF